MIRPYKHVRIWKVKNNVFSATFSNSSKKNYCKIGEMKDSRLFGVESAPEYY